MIAGSDEIYLYRKEDANVLYEGELITREINEEPYSSSYLQVELDSAQTGTLSLYGSAIETLTFDNSEFAETDNQFTVLTGMTASSLSGSMIIRAVNNSGEPITRQIFIRKFKGMFTRENVKQYFELYGMDTKFGGILYAPADIDIQLNDIVKIDKPDADKSYMVDMIDEIRLFGKVQHKEIVLNLM